MLKFHLDARWCSSTGTRYPAYFARGLALRDTSDGARDTQPTDGALLHRRVAREFVTLVDELATACVAGEVRTHIMHERNGVYIMAASSL